MSPCLPSKGTLHVLITGICLSPCCQLPDDFADSYKKQFGVPPPDDIITHCRRELYHAVVERILKGEFEEVYKNGIIIMFPDGVQRRVFPRFYCYSADYPEKYDLLCCIIQQPLTSVSRVLIATIKNLGKCPCPCCLIELGEVWDLGKVIDKQRRANTRKPTHNLFRIIKKARKAIFKGFKVSGSRVEGLLGGGSRVAVNVCLPLLPIILPLYR